MPTAASMTKTFCLAALALAAGACRSRAKAPDATDYTRAMNAYLQKRGDLCIARADWPVDVTPGDVAEGTRDAVQMPVLEKLKLVESAPVPQAPGVTRYRLTALGKQQYIDRETRRPVSPDGPRQGMADFCVARLSLDQIKHVELHQVPNVPPHAVITYTYDVAAPDWTRDPAARRVFPAVDRVVSGAHTASLREELTLTPDGWVANELLPAAGASGAVAAKTAERP
ncbi:MAG TPA: hypothetical protein VMT03_26595 [Polyangia bacterium]|nr:hypothetical protein [Polyangia bacterium]